MNNIQELLNFEPKEKTNAPHELADSVCHIRDHIGFNKRFGFGYWLKRVKNKGLTYFQVCELVKKAHTLDPKYNKAGWLSNQMK